MQKRLMFGVFVAMLIGAQVVQAQLVPVRVTFESLVPDNSVSFAPLRFGFGNGTFDAFHENEVAPLFGNPSIAEAPIVTIAEGGSGSTWFPAFEATEPNANLGSVIGPVIGPFLPGQSNSTVIMVDPSNRYFTFGTMVVPSNDHFIGNDDPVEYEIFDTSGNLILNSITQTAGEIWDAGSETEDPANAAFLVGGTSSQRVNENLPVLFNFSDLSAFNGLETAAGYIFDSSLLTSSTEISRITFSVVPEPSSLSLTGLAGLAFLRRRRR